MKIKKLGHEDIQKVFDNTHSTLRESGVKTHVVGSIELKPATKEATGCTFTACQGPNGTTILKCEPC
jgi:hypothetical protein